MGAKDSILTGTAGEHYVLYRLLLEGLLASLSPTNAYAADILVFSPRMLVGSMVQVKTRTTGRDSGWHMRRKHETLVHPRLFYAFVDLERASPVVHIVPSEVVADVLRRAHGAWLSIPGIRGQPHRDSDLRRILPRYAHPVPGLDDGWLDHWLERWDLLKEETAGSGIE
jgi:hypothetical protein